MESRDIGSCCRYQPNKDWLSVTAFLQTDDDGAFIAVVDLRALDMPDDLRNWPLFMARPLAARAAAPAASVR